MTTFISPHAPADCWNLGLELLHDRGGSLLVSTESACVVFPDAFLRLAFCTVNIFSNNKKSTAREKKHKFKV